MWLRDCMRCITLEDEMPVRRVATFRVDADLIAAMEALKERDGMPLSEQIRRALRPWLEGKGVMAKADLRHAPTRRKS
jgi:hypothetical protein